MWSCLTNIDCCRILDATGKKLFSVYLLHSLPLKMSAIQLFVGDKMVVVAHLVGKDTLGEHNEEFGLSSEVMRLDLPFD